MDCRVMIDEEGLAGAAARSQAHFKNQHSTIGNRQSMERLICVSRSSDGASGHARQVQGG
jgi:hypothetical protein